MITKEKILEQIHSIPTLPTIYTTVSRAMDDPYITNEKIAELISADQSSSFKILRVANSPFFGFRGKINTISQAIFYLGHNEVKNILFTISLLKIMPGSKILTKLKPADLWAHSVSTGVISRIIGAEINDRQIENFFLAGVLHDFGKILLIEYFNKEYAEVLEISQNTNVEVSVVESDKLGITHSELGAKLAEKWKLPDIIIDTLRNHHKGRSNNSNNDFLVAAVHIADIVSKLLALGYSGDNIVKKPTNSVWQKIKLSEKFFTINRKKIIHEYEHIFKMLMIN
ncbi:HDOD domain-containing protein [Melioribacter sp. OK-6-Me]|uniref:HDOD domain-containing protein n=1 Tax=unclassified Melioribacter TaxID=2627329 RepID=UPI003EDA53BC